MSLKNIDKAIASFTTNRNKLRDQAHTIAMMIFRHAAPAELPDCVGSGDCTRALNLVKAMPGSWALQMTEWFKSFTPIRVVEKNGKVGFDPEYRKLKTVEEKLKWWNLEAANATPFHEVVEEQRPDKVYDFKALVAMVERLGKQIEKKIADGAVPEQDIESAKAIARTVSGLHFSKVEQDNTPAEQPVGQADALAVEAEADKRVVNTEGLKKAA